MSDAEFGGPTGAATVTATESADVGRVAAVGTALVALNVLLMLALSYTPAAELGLLLFSNFLVGIAVFGVTVGGGYWVAEKGLERDSLPLAGVGVTLAQAGYGLLGAAILVVAPSSLRAPALGIAAVVTGLVTAGVVLVVYRTDRSFESWQRYAGGLFIGGLAVGAIGYFVAPPLVLLAGVLFFLGFVVDLTYEIWAVKEARYGTLRSAIGVYIAVMGVFIHVLQWVLRVLELFDA